MARVYRKSRGYTKRHGCSTAIKKCIRKEIGKKLEVKYSIVNDVRANMSTTPFAINPFDYIYSQTTSLSMPRVGNQVNITGLMLRSVLEGADSPHNRVRILLLKTREQLPVNLLGGSYDATRCFDPVFATQGINTPVDRNIVSRVFMDKTYNLQLNVDGVGLTGAQVMRTCNRFMKHHEKVNWNGETQSSDTVGTKLQNNFYLVMFSDSAAIPHPTITYNVKTWFTDA